MIKTVTNTYSSASASIKLSFSIDHSNNLLAFSFPITFINYKKPQMQCDAMRCDATHLRCDASAMRCDASAMRCDAMQCNPMQCNAMQSNAIQSMQCNPINQSINQSINHSCVSSRATSRLTVN